MHSTTLKIFRKLRKLTRRCLFYIRKDNGLHCSCNDPESMMIGTYLDEDSPMSGVNGDVHVCLMCRGLIFKPTGRY